MMDERKNGSQEDEVSLLAMTRQDLGMIRFWQVSFRALLPTSCRDSASYLGLSFLFCATG